MKQQASPAYLMNSLQVAAQKFIHGRLVETLFRLLKDCYSPSAIRCIKTKFNGVIYIRPSRETRMQAGCSSTPTSIRRSTSTPTAF